MGRLSYHHALPLAGFLAWCLTGCLGQPGDRVDCDEDSRIAEVALGRDHVCARMSNGRIFCWGQNDQGQLGHDNLVASSRPVHVESLLDAVHVAVGQDHSCAVTEDGAAYCWGSGSNGQLGDDNETEAQAVPVAVLDLEDVRQLSLGDDFSCALDGEGTVSCWGENERGQVGDGSGDQRTRPRAVTWPTDAAAATRIAVGATHGCAIDEGQDVYCWGSNEFGQLGDGSQIDEPTPSGPLPIGDVVAIAAGGNHTCAVIDGGSLLCWGDNLHGELAADPATLEFSGEPIEVDLPLPVLAVSAGLVHTCALLDGGDVHCWGGNGEGQLGDSLYEDRFEPSRVALAGGAAGLSSGDTVTCAIEAAEDQLVCWGGNRAAQLGQTPTLTQSAPVPVATVTDADEIAASGEHTCVRVDGEISCWGKNVNGQLGDGTLQSRATSGPVDGGYGDAIAITSGEDHGCLLNDAGDVFCWGKNEDGQVLPGGADQLSSPVQFPLAGNATRIAAGLEHTCAVVNATALCWGRNVNGQLGDGTETGAGPVAVGLSGVTEVAPGGDHTCALHGGAVSCWGDNEDGQLGDGTTTPSSMPRAVVDLGGVVTSLASGDDFTCALLASGKVKCWGKNETGQLGNGTTANSSLPVEVADLSGVIDIVAGAEHACAIVLEGDGDTRTLCWGRNASGQIGDPSYEPSTTPFDVPGLPQRVEAIAAGLEHTCAIVRAAADGDAAVYCWGSDVDGKLGSGRQLYFATPTGPLTVCLPE